MGEIEIVKEQEGAVNRLWIREEVVEKGVLGIYLVLNGVKILEIKNGYMKSITNKSGFGVPLKDYFFENNELKNLEIITKK